ncbi:hypothetical protein [Halopelagius longus]|uniref:DUF8130 domain-containing protein n=1 Tax=Halopelagius longus TaxID=1236180 RepID=A0A1H0XWF9_9EURY|nr:hypothetical protein [Halopelagius longus]RDI72134.1 hypothetical protein DWB78_10645 [Halopelagius longus]SDQ07220.1 hypothetical protein SAMN05216278_0237 [Halopelagius longus]
MKRRRFLASVAAAGAAVGAGVVHRTRRYELAATAERFDYGLRFNDLGTEQRGESVELSSFPASVRPTLRQAAAVPGVFGTNDLSASVAERLREADYLRADGRYYTTYVSDVRDVPLSVDVAVRESLRAPFDPAAFSLSLRNEGAETVAVAAGPPMPFGVVGAHRPDDRESRLTLWSDEYRDAPGVSTVGRRVLSMTGLGTETAVEPGETVGTVYELGRGGAGTWLLDGDVGVSVEGRDADGGDGHDGGDFPYRVRLDVRRRSPW